MRRALAALLVLLSFVVLALGIARGGAAPLAHVYPGMSLAPVTIPHQGIDPFDWAGTEQGDAHDCDGSAGIYAHAGQPKDYDLPLKQAKACEASGACCAPFVLATASENRSVPGSLSDPCQMAAGVGTRPSGPDRPPRQRLA